MEKEIRIRKANRNDLSRIAEIPVFNYRLFFYPIFQSDAYYFDELRVPSIMQKYETDLDSLAVHTVHATHTGRTRLGHALDDACWRQ